MESEVLDGLVIKRPILPTFTGVPYASYELEDPTIASLQIVPKVNGLKALGLLAGGSILHVYYPDGTGDFFLVRVGPPPKGATALGWGSWHTYYAGSWSDQKHYSQEWDLASCCSGGWSGCGATAWAMFYGYWDAKGVSSLIGGTSGTPMHNDSYVQTCLQHIFGYIDTYCVGDQGATNPWDMDEGDLGKRQQLLVWHGWLLLLILLSNLKTHRAEPAGDRRAAIARREGRRHRNDDDPG